MKPPTWSFMIQDDPGETRNLATSQPDVVAALRAILKKHPEAAAPIQANKKKKNPKF